VAELAERVAVIERYLNEVPAGREEPAAANAAE
jgi:hypothetical protein